ADWPPKLRMNPDGHLTDEQLLLAADGELSPRDSEEVRVHVEACWACRERQQRIGEAIVDVVRYRDRVVREVAPPSASGSARLAGKLERLAADLGRPTGWRQALRRVMQSEAGANAVLLPARRHSFGVALPALSGVAAVVLLLVLLNRVAAPPASTP